MSDATKSLSSFASATSGVSLDTKFTSGALIDPLTAMQPRSTLEIQSQGNAIVNSPFTSGVFTVGSTGKVGFDYLFDGGAYKGQLAIFSLTGLDQVSPPGSDVWIKEAARRALSDSMLGHVVISDATDGAKFHGHFVWEKDYNSGQYLGLRTFDMQANDQFGVMLVPNGKVADVLAGKAGDALRPLFSVVAANPAEAFHLGQIADVTGNGSTFVFEDLRIDGKTDRDYNDVIFQVRGATGKTAKLDDFISTAKDWRTTDVGKQVLDYIAFYDKLPTADIGNSLKIDIPKLDAPQVDAPKIDQPIIGIIDTGFSDQNPDIDYSRIILGQDRVDGDNNPLIAPGEGNQHGTHVLGIIGATQGNGIGIDGINDKAPIWLGRAVGSGHWAESLVEFVDTAKKSEQPNAIVNLSFDLTQKNSDGSVTTRFELTPQERQALEYARQNNILIVAAAGNQGGTMSALGQASQEFDNIITVGAIDYTEQRASYSSFGYGLDIVAYGGTPDQPILSTVGRGEDLKKIDGDINVQWLNSASQSDRLETAVDPTSSASNQVNHWGTEVVASTNTYFLPQAPSSSTAEASDELSDDQMSTAAKDIFQSVFGEFEDVSEAELKSLTPEERQVYDEATSEIDQLLNTYLGEASRKLALEYVDGFYETQVNALSQFVDTFDENVVGTLIQAQDILREAGYDVELPIEATQDAPFDLGLGTMAGTSIATARVTGIASQVWAANPKLSYTQIKQILKVSATDLGTPGWDVETGAGKVNLAKSISLAQLTKPEAHQSQPIVSPLSWSGEGKVFPSERPVWYSVPAFTGQIMNAGYVNQVGFLRIRSGPGTGFQEVGRFSPGSVVTFDAVENNGSWVPDPYMPGGGSSRWYRISGTNNWMSGLYFNNSPEQAEQERQRLEAIRRAEEEARRAEEEVRQAEAKLHQIEEEQRLRQEQFQASVSTVTQRYGSPGALIGSSVSNGVTVYQFEKGQLFAQPDGHSSFYSSEPREAPADKTSDRFHLHITYETLAKKEAYNNYEPNSLIDGYTVERVFKDDVTGLYAIGLTKVGQAPVLVFRGTESSTIQDLFTDLDPRGIGAGQFSSAERQGIEDWLREKNRSGNKPDVIGHSLGGALAQMTTAKYGDLIGQTVTFNSPGVDDYWSQLFKGGDVTHYISQGDVVSQGGQRFLRGKVYQIKVSGNPLEQHTNLLLPNPNVVCIPLSEQSVDDLDNAPLRIPIELFRKYVGSIFGGAYPVVDILSSTQSALSSGVKVLSDLSQNLFNAARKTAEETVSRAKAAYQVAQSAVQQTKAAYQFVKQEIAQRTTQIVQQAQQKVQEAARAVAQKVLNNPVVRAASNVVSGVVRTASAVINHVASYAKKAVQAVTNVINGARQFVSNAIETGKQIVNNVIETAKQTYQEVKNFVSEKVEQGKQFVAEQYNRASQAVSNTVSTISNGFNGLKSMFGW